MADLTTSREAIYPSKRSIELGMIEFSLQLKWQNARNNEYKVLFISVMNWIVNSNTVLYNNKNTLT
jgi:hypothetical protein